MHLIIGLGNPGAKYQLTRHNIGFMIIEALAHHFGSPHFKSEHRAEVTKIKNHSKPLLLAKPQTFMNLSGESVRSLVDYYNIDLKKLLIIHDEVDLPFGSIKYQYQRGHGGHNGIRSAHQHLKTNEYSRLRVGIGRPENNQMEVANYVLQKFSDKELKELPDFLSHTGESIMYFIEKGFSSTANHYNQNDQNERDVN